MQSRNNHKTLGYSFMLKVFSDQDIRKKKKEKCFVKKKKKDIKSFFKEHTNMMVFKFWENIQSFAKAITLNPAVNDMTVKDNYM